MSGWDMGQCIDHENRGYRQRVVMHIQKGITSNMYQLEGMLTVGHIGEFEETAGRRIYMYTSTSYTHAKLHRAQGWFSGISYIELHK